MIYQAGKELEGKVKGIESESFYMSLGALLRGINEDSLGVDYETRRKHMEYICIIAASVVLVTLLLLIGLRIKIRKD